MSQRYYDAWDAIKRMSERSSLSFLSDEPDLYEEDASKALDSILQVDKKADIHVNDIAKAVEKYAKLVPTMVPAMLECSPAEFMEFPVEHFNKLCEKHTYGKVINSLTYVQNIASRDSATIKERVAELKAALKVLKEQRTSHSTENRSIPYKPVAANRLLDSGDFT